MKLSSSASANAPRSEVPPRRRLTRKFKRADAVLPGSALALSLEGRCVALRAYDGADLGPRDVGVAANLAKLAGGQTGGALVESVTAPLTMTQHGWDKLYAEYKESGE